MFVLKMSLLVDVAADAITNTVNSSPQTMLMLLAICFDFFFSNLFF